METAGRSISTKTEDGVAWISIERPEQRNAIDSAARLELSAAFAWASDSEDVRVIVLYGVGGSFSAGVDLKEGASSERHVMMRDQPPLAAPVENCPKPVIAAIDGPAVGGGFEMALAADIRVATPRSFFALTELRIGSLPGSGGTQRIFDALPSAVAWRLLLTGERMEADRAYEVGLISDLIGIEGFADSVQEMAAGVANSAPLSLRAAKLAGRAGMARSGETGMTLERALWAFLSTTEDRAEGRAAFREGRKPDFEGR